jgi:hypothetical protein
VADSLSEMSFVHRWKVLNLPVSLISFIIHLLSFFLPNWIDFTSEKITQMGLWSLYFDGDIFYWFESGIFNAKGSAPTFNETFFLFFKMLGSDFLSTVF